jgi:hypothetical protein
MQRWNHWNDWNRLLGLYKHFYFLERNRDQLSSRHQSPLDVIPFMLQYLEKPSITAVTNGNVNDLRRSAEDQRAIVEVNVFTEDDETFYSAAFPNVRISRC